MSALMSRLLVEVCGSGHRDQKWWSNCTASVVLRPSLTLTLYGLAALLCALEKPFDLLVLFAQFTGSNVKVSSMQLIIKCRH